MQALAGHYFYKLLIARPPLRLPERLYLYYNGLPLSRQAIYFGDRYVFPLPTQLAEKMRAGGLHADICYTDPPIASISKRMKDPTCIKLSDRY